MSGDSCGLGWSRLRPAWTPARPPRAVGEERRFDPRRPGSRALARRLAHGPALTGCQPSAGSDRSGMNEGESGGRAPPTPTGSSVRKRTHPFPPRELKGRMLAGRPNLSQRGNSPPIPHSAELGSSLSETHGLGEPGLGRARTPGAPTEAMHQCACASFPALL